MPPVCTQPPCGDSTGPTDPPGPNCTVPPCGGPTGPNGPTDPNGPTGPTTDPTGPTAPTTDAHGEPKLQLASKFSTIETEAKSHVGLYYAGASLMLAAAVVTCAISAKRDTKTNEAALLGDDDTASI